MTSQTAGEGQPTVIRTPHQRLRVFVSSTLKELSPERDAARKAISALRLTPIMFELGARPYPPRDLYRAYLEQSHIFIGIYWQQYGWVAPDMEISGLEDEYLLASDIPKLIYFKSPAPEREDGLQALVNKLRNSGLSYKYFSAAGAQFEALGTAIWPADRVESGLCVVNAQANLDETAYTAAQKTSQVLSLEEAMRRARQLTG